MNSIKVGRIKIHLKGISSEVAQSSFSGLGNELMRQIAKQSYLTKGKGIISISEIDGGTFQTGRATASSDLKYMIVGKITESIASKIKNTSKGD